MAGEPGPEVTQERHDARALEAEIGVPFNALSRIERGVGNASGVNTQRILNWLAGQTDGVS